MTERRKQFEKNLEQTLKKLNRQNTNPQAEMAAGIITLLYARALRNENYLPKQNLPQLYFPKKYMTKYKKKYKNR